MAKLTTAQRKNLPNSAFLVIKKNSQGKVISRGYPFKNADNTLSKGHLKAAIMLSGRSQKVGNISSKTRSKIVSKARKKLTGTPKPTKRKY